MYLSLIFLPFLSFIFLNFFSYIIGKKLANFILFFGIIFSFIFSLLIFFEVVLNKSICYINLWKYINIMDLSVNMGVKVDNITSIMYIVIIGVSLLVHIYSIEYMSGEINSIRFLSYLSLFTFFMLVLVSGDNLFVIFIGWEGVGISSYLLINYWYNRINANKSAIKAVVINRIGDLFFILGIIYSIYYFGTINIEELNSIIIEQEKIKINIICLFLFLASMGKSAQLFLHMWLADAMEGPTPVSALIHAATMVTAGIFLIVRLSFIYENSILIRNIIQIIGLLTLLFSGIMGLFQNDIKRVIAYSTCSQLGYMLYSCGLSYYNVALFHLFNHAFFKALLFLSAGVIIHKLIDEQDMRKMGEEKNLILTYVYILIASISLMGIPFFSGYYSKDLIIELSLNKYNSIGNWGYIITIFSAIITILYSYKILYMVYLREKIKYILKMEIHNNFGELKLLRLLEEFRYRDKLRRMTNEQRIKTININKLKKQQEKIELKREFKINKGISLFILFLGSIFSGYIFKDLFIGVGSDFLNGGIYILNEDILNIENISNKIKIIGIIIIVISVIIINIYTKTIYNKINYFIFKGIKEKKKNNIKYVYDLFINKFYFDKLINKYIILNIMNYGYIVSLKIIDEGVLQIIMGEKISIKLKMLVKYGLKKLEKKNFLELIIINIIIIIIIIIGIELCI